MRKILASLGFRNARRIVLSWILLCGGSASAVDITTCGQVVPAGDMGVLQADLTGCDHFAVQVGDRGTLQMNGHSIVGSIVFSVECTGKHCAIVGPGEIANGGGERGEGEISQTFAGRGRPRMTLSDLNIHDNGAAFISIGGIVTATNVVVNHNVTLNPSSSNPTGDYIAVGTLRLTGTNLQVTDNVGWGIFTNTLRLTNSVVTGNDGDGTGIDFFSRRRPVLITSTCGESMGPTGPWGVCTSD